jgi:hypothetical protein
LRRLLRTNHPLRRIGALGGIVLAALCGGTAMMMDRLHDETVAEATLGLRTLNASLAEQTLRAIEGIELTVSGVVDQIPAANRRSADAFKRLGADYEPMNS